MICEFQGIRLDVKARQIWRGEETVHLTRKAFELLLLLLEQRPHVVSSDQIHAHLWPKTFVTESSVQRLVSEIRQALGDDGHRQAILRTVHGVGYAFNAEVHVASPSGASPAEANVRAWLVAEYWHVPLHHGDNVIGREGDDVTKIDAPTISRRHARIRIEDDIVIEDLGSKNGTWVRDERVTGPTPVAEGDVIRLGSLVCSLRLVRSGEPTDTAVVEPSPPDHR